MELKIEIKLEDNIDKPNKDDVLTINIGDELWTRMTFNSLEKKLAYLIIIEEIVAFFTKEAQGE